MGAMIRAPPAMDPSQSMTSGSGSTSTVNHRISPAIGASGKRLTALVCREGR